MLDLISALVGLGVLIGIPIWAAAGMPRTPPGRRVLIATAGVAVTFAWVALVLWLAAR